MSGMTGLDRKTDWPLLERQMALVEAAGRCGLLKRFEYRELPDLEKTAAFIRLRVHSSHQVHQQQQDGDRDDDEHRDWEEQPGAVVVPPSQHEKRCYHAYRKPTRTEGNASCTDNQDSQAN
ncbi:hypothetical protein U1737_09625 [Sphingomonas sp. LB3N6]|uniref:hypothetical protein n=1 Tax=Sphingomonas fucosidasi TaxID=3096164 RepID=UPI002FC777EA